MRAEGPFMRSRNCILFWRNSGF